MLDLELWSQLVGIQGNFNTIPCKSAMEHLGSSGHMENVSIFYSAGNVSDTLPAHKICN